MNDKERLEAIKKKFSAQRSVNARAYESLDLYDLSYEEGDWLIEQAEKASRLELEIEYWKSLWEQAVNEKAEKVEQLQKQLERKEQALEEMFQNRERWRISHGELEQELQQKKEKEKQYKEALENIQALSFFTNFTDTERFNAALHHAELVLKETK
jgi:chromosome segregation ATPase